MLGLTDTAYITDDNPFGVNPDDPYGKDDVLVEDSTVHIPVGKPVKVVLRSKDVLHDFFVPEFRARMNLVPGSITYFWFTPTKVGKYEILCAQLCGVGHYAMRGTVIVDDQNHIRRVAQDCSRPSPRRRMAADRGVREIWLMKLASPELHDHAMRRG